MKKSILAALVAVAALVGPPIARAQQSSQPGAQVQQPPEGGVAWDNVGYGALTVLADCVYVPVKLVYAGLGGITGGAAYGITGGNRETADTIWRSSLGGDYVLTPPMIKGDQPIYFSGPTQTPQQVPEMPPAAQMTTGGAPNMAGGSPAMAGSGSAAAYPTDRGTGPVTGKSAPYSPSGSDIE